MRLTTLDYILSVMDTAKSSVDFAIVFHFDTRLNLNALLAGAQSARNAFPATGCRLEHNRWIRHQGSSRDSIAATSCDTHPKIKNFIDRPFDLQKEFPVQQLVISNSIKSKTTLVTRFHHAAADGMSAALWLRHQFEVMHGLRGVESRARSHDSPALKSPASAVRKSCFAYSGPSDRLATSSVSRSGSRSWATIEIDALRMRKLIRRAGGFTYSDFLATCALEVYTRWNRLHDSEPAQKIGLWLPINVRQRPGQGFGNGTSRIRIYARYPPSASFAEKCREVRRQIEWCTTHGEWAIPEMKGLTLLPRSLTGGILRRNLTRRSLDMATGVFSHADKWNSSSDGVFNRLDQIECVGLLHPFHALAINGATHNGKTWLTFTYDTGLLTHTDVTQLIGMYQEQIHLAQSQLL